MNFIFKYSIDNELPKIAYNCANQNNGQGKRRHYGVVCEFMDYFVNLFPLSPRQPIPFTLIYFRKSPQRRAFPKSSVNSKLVADATRRRRNLLEVEGRRLAAAAVAELTQQSWPELSSERGHLRNPVFPWTPKECTSMRMAQPQPGLCGADGTPGSTFSRKFSLWRNIFFGIIGWGKF
jgi:hypothetical protein